MALATLSSISGAYFWGEMKNPSSESTARFAAGASFTRKCSLVGAATLIAVGPMLLPAQPARAADPETPLVVEADGVVDGSDGRPIHFEVSSTTISAPGQTIDYTLTIFGTKTTGSWRIPTAFSAEIDLTKVVDDVADLDDVFDSLAFTPIAGVQVSRVGSVLKVEGPAIPHDVDFVLTFSAVFEEGGDGILDTTAQVSNYQVDYGTADWNMYHSLHLFEMPILAPHPAPLVSVVADRSSAAPGSDVVTYTINVTRPGGSVADSFVLSDDISDLLAESGNIVPSGLQVTTGSNQSIAVNGNQLSGVGVYDASGKFTLTYTTKHLGLGDGKLTNTVTATSPERGEAKVSPGGILTIQDSRWGGQTGYPPGLLDSSLAGSGNVASASVVTFAPSTPTATPTSTGTPTATSTPTATGTTPASPTDSDPTASELASTGGGDVAPAILLAGATVVGGLGLLAAARVRTRRRG